MKELACKPGLGGVSAPRVCDAPTMGGDGNPCGKDPYVIIPNKCQYVDQQTLKMQVRVYPVNMTQACD